MAEFGYRYCTVLKSCGNVNLLQYVPYKIQRLFEGAKQETETADACTARASAERKESWKLEAG